MDEPPPDALKQYWRLKRMGAWDDYSIRWQLPARIVGPAQYAGAIYNAYNRYKTAPTASSAAKDTAVTRVVEAVFKARKERRKRGTV